MIYEDKLNSVLEEIVARWGIPGLGVGIFEAGEIVYTRYFGVQSLDTRAPVTPDSIFCITSISKCFVATAVMQLVERGKIDLDAPATVYLPYFKLDDERYMQVTIRRMLSHTSGMPDLDESEYDALIARPETDDGCAERYVRSLSGLKLAAAPGERFLYSNIAYNVLGDLIAKVSGQTFEAYMQENILLPAGMPDSTFLLADVERRRLAVPHLRTPETRVNPLYPYHRADAPASFLHSTISDMCHWGITALNGCNNNGRRLLSPASYDLMWTPVARWGYPPLYEDIGLGWTLGHFEGFKTVSHGGMGFGWTDFFTIVPEKQCGMALLCNDESLARSQITRALINAMLDREPHGGTVSWMIPICQALAEGGLPAARRRYAEIQDSPEYYFDEDELLIPARQLVSVKKFDQAIEVLKLNLQVFPEHIETYTSLALLYLQQGAPTQAEDILRKALALKPDDVDVAAMLEKVPRQAGQ